MSSHHAQIARLSQLLEDWDYKLDRLTHRLADIPQELQAEAKEKLKELKDYRANLIEQERKLRETTEKSIEELEALIDVAQDTFTVLYTDLTPELKMEFS